MTLLVSGNFQTYYGHISTVHKSSNLVNLPCRGIPELAAFCLPEPKSALHWRSGKRQLPKRSFGQLRVSCLCMYPFGVLTVYMGQTYRPGLCEAHIYLPLASPCSVNGGLYDGRVARVARVDICATVGIVVCILPAIKWF